MLALDRYEHGLKCPLCGMDTAICHDEDRTERLFAGAQVELCFVTQLRERAMSRYEASGVVDTQAQTTTLIPRHPDL